MKIKYAGLLTLLALVGCTTNTNTSDVVSSENIISQESSVESVASTPVSSEQETSSVKEESSQVIEVSSSISSGEVSSSIVSKESSVSSSIVSSIDSISSSVISYDKLPVPENKNNKVVLDQKGTTFEFNDFLPDNFRTFYGNNIVASYNMFYANGQLDINTNSSAKKGFQTCMFTADLKLEVRLLVGEVYGSNNKDKINKDIPCVEVKGFDEEGNEIETLNFDTKSTYNKDQKNFELKGYMHGEDISYLEVRQLQPFYNSKQTLNFAYRGIMLKAFPYALD